MRGFIANFVPREKYVDAGCLPDKNNHSSVCKFLEMVKDRLLTPSFCYILAANFLLFFAFYLLLPVMPFYLKEHFMASKSMIGIVLSCYTIACLCIRPFSGYLLDSFSRKPLYLFSFLVFTAVFGGYMIAGALFLFLMQLNNCPRLGPQ